MDFDYIIVGGGSAGCVLANRLSERNAIRVLLVEAGKDYPPGTEPADILSSFVGRAYFDPNNIWAEMRVHLHPLPHNEPPPPARSRYEQARLIGGGSSINGQMANRGTPADYDAWEAKGARGWGWEGVVPYFVRMETDHDFGGPLHGKSGPQGIRRIFPPRWPGFTRATAEAFKDAGYPYVEDQNADFRDGYIPMAISNVGDRRMSAAMAYLTNEVRARPNLAIRCETRLKGLVFEDRKAVGIEVVGGDGAAETIRAREVILSTGALHTPAVLMRAGIGPAAHLKEHGVPVLADLPGVGQNLQDHPAVSVSAYLKPEARLGPARSRQFLIALRYSSGLPGCPPSDMYLTATNRAAWHPIGARLGALNAWINKPFSTGQVRLASADWRAEPRIEFNLLKDQRDADRLTHAVRMIDRFYQHPAMAACSDTRFPTCYNERVRKVGTVTFANWIKTGAFALMLDSLPFARARLVTTFITEGVTLDGLLADPQALDSWVKRSAAGIWHASCTCRMGADDDPMAVLDPALRVRGVGGLRVADASAMPEVPRANTNIPTMMLAEKAADLVLADA